jgi:GTP-binding protein
MDSGDLERERGITILAKNTSVWYNNIKINIVDTPGHADFGGEVERALQMASGALLLVDAAEGPMPQTRFVLEKAFRLGLKLIIVINKVDRPESRIFEVVNEILELIIDLDPSGEQLDAPTLFCSARRGCASLDPGDTGDTLEPLFSSILDHIPPPSGNAAAPFQMLVSSIDYNEYVGRLAIGRIERGELKRGDTLAVSETGGNAPVFKGKVATAFTFEGLSKEPTESASAGEIVAIAGFPDITIGQTICAEDCPEPLPYTEISPPTMEMTFSVNDSPFAGQEGKFVTSRHLRDRLYRELLRDVALRVSDAGSADAFHVAGRGEMHLSILIETMRREGYEFQVSTPRVLNRVENGVTLEPIEELVADLPETCVGSVIDKLGRRRGELSSLAPVGSRIRLKFLVPSRCLFGYRSEFLSDTRGEGVMSTVFSGYAPIKGGAPGRANGALVAFETGESTGYGLFNAQDRGALFIGPGVSVYAGMIVGVSSRDEDISVNICKRKQLTNMRASGSDDALRLTPPQVMSLEECLGFLQDDELLEVTPQNLRLRKRILSHENRMKAAHKNAKT